MPDTDLTNIHTYSDAKAAGLPVFKVFSDGVGKAYTAEDGTRWFELTASSDSTDLVGDFFLESALKQMEEAAEGTTMFLNHSYNVPDDVFGIVKSANLVHTKIKKGGKLVDVLQLVYKGIVAEDNEQAVKVHKMIEAKQCKLGASISVLIVDAKEQKDGRRAISDIYYLECSIVGIPCNPDCWAKAASKALKVLDPDSESPTPLQQQTTPKAMPDGESSKEKAMNMKVAQKGMFNRELQRSESSIYHLVERILYNALWNLYYECMYGSDDVDAAAELEMICDEFKATIIERFLPVLQGDNAASKSAAFLDSIDKALDFLSADSTLRKDLSAITKSGRRNSTADQKMLDDIHKLSVDLGAACEPLSETVDDTSTVNKTGALVPTTKAVDNQIEKTAPGANAASSASVTDLEAKIASMTTQIQTLAEENKTLKDEKTTLLTDKSALETTLSEAEAERDQWKACSLAQQLFIAELAEQPLPRAGNESHLQ